MDPQPDTEALRLVVTDYLESMIYRDADQLRRAFHPEAIAAGHSQGQYYLTLTLTKTDDAWQIIPKAWFVHQSPTG